MKITYIYHSGYAVEFEHAVLIFDYYKGALPKWDKQKAVYVFVSHNHYDHFNKKIFEWEREYDHITYILSDDVPVKPRVNQVFSIKPREELLVDALQIKALRSTDEGVAFLITYGDICLYHAGDLNWWHWEEESHVYNEMMRRNYQYEIRLIEGTRIDAAFVPLDPRQEAQYYWGIDWFMRNTDTKAVFPMHFGEEVSVCGRLVKDTVSEPYRDRIMCIREPGQTFERVEGDKK